MASIHRRQRKNKRLVVVLQRYQLLEQQEQRRWLHWMEMVVQEVPPPPQFHQFNNTEPIPLQPPLSMTVHHHRQSTISRFVPGCNFIPSLVSLINHAILLLLFINQYY